MFKDDIKSIPEPWIIHRSCEDNVTFIIVEQGIVKLEVLINAEFKIKLKLYQNSVNPLYLSFFDPQKMRVNYILSCISSQKLCPGVVNPELLPFSEFPERDANENCPYFKQVSGLGGPNYILSTVRSKSCAIFLGQEYGKVICTKCTYTRALLKRKKARRDNPKPISLHHPLHCCANDELILAYKELRKHEKELNTKLEKFRQQVDKDDDNVSLNENLHNTLSKIIKENQGVCELTDLFWKEQLKAFSRKQRGMRWHPQMIRLAIHLHCRSPSAYRALMETGILRLPGESTLRDYSNAIHSTPGFSLAAIEDLKRQARDLPDEYRFVALLHDEMSIRKDLVFDRVSGQVIGFVKPHMFHQEVEESLATHVLVFYVVGFNSHIKGSIGFFPTRSATAGDLYTKLWKAICYLELFVCTWFIVSFITN